MINKTEHTKIECDHCKAVRVDTVAGIDRSFLTMNVNSEQIFVSCKTGLVAPPVRITGQHFCDVHCLCKHITQKWVIKTTEKSNKGYDMGI